MKPFKTLMLVALVVFLMTLFASCVIRNSNSYPDHNKGSDYEAVNKIDSTDAPSVPYSNDLPKWYYSFEEFNNAVVSKKEVAYNINSISYYFTPEYIPEGVYLNYIQVKDAYVAIYYSISDKDNDYLVFEWYRLLKEGQLKSGVLYSFAESSISFSNDYYVVKGEESTLFDIFWEQDGYVFHAVVPSDVQFEEWNRFCRSKRIELESDSSINAQYTTSNEHHENESTTEPMSTEEPALPSAIIEYTPYQADPIISASPTDDSAKNYLDDHNGSNEAIQPQLSLKSNDIIVKPMSFIYSSETYMEDLKALIHTTAAPIDLSSIMVSLPELSIEDEYHILVGANEKLISVSLCSIDAQDPDNIKWITVSEPLNLFKPNDYADILDNKGTIIVQIRIAVPGKTIPEIGQSENYIYSCLFKISRI